MIEVMAPNETPTDALFRKTIFLAGSIEMGVADNWQDRVKHDLKDYDVVLYNPRRLDWNSAWIQSIHNKEFKEQVNWELDRICNADMVVFYFDPNTKSPVTLMELGYVLGRGILQDIIVCCPDGFWRKGNVEVLCENNDVEVLNTYEQFLNCIEDYIL